MRIGLFVPCYVDQFYPGAAIATYQLLTKLGMDVTYPENQTCCGQPMANSGFEHLTDGCNSLFIDQFSEFDYIVSPSGSCVLHVKEHLKNKNQPDLAIGIRKKVYELVEFLVDILGVQELDASFPHKVGLHQSCHGQRGLMLSQMSELAAPFYSKPLQLLKLVKGLELVELSREDECCGFGGTFCVAEEAVSVKMGKDRLKDHLSHGATFITGSDMSCLMHMEGILKRDGSEVRVLHIAEILNAE
ncbi:(Fe-S)-binding protein [Pedobacter antarcticus]|uniref:(Fe-S)-binding protein n=1 Tax=Pedobacter antarcticus TaxID=34086 RepID=UPI002931472D|nr:(Fe-S)-binding protein [Pedobacter antarcticus]